MQRTMRISTMMWKTLVRAALAAVAAMALSIGVAARAQDPPPPAAAAPQRGPISAAQIQQWFEAYTVLQAQEALALSDAQYGPFVTRFKALHTARRRHQQARNRILAELRKFANAQGTPPEEAIVERLSALRHEHDRAAAEIAKALEGVDETLDVRQRARFRVFEERMEQHKLELLIRARQNARAQRGRGKS